MNCLIAFTNNPHSLDVSLNAIAFLRFCAMKLAEGAIGALSPSQVLVVVPPVVIVSDSPSVHEAASSCVGGLFVYGRPPW